MNSSVSGFDHAHQMGEPATRPIAGLPGSLAALLVVAGSDHAPPRALPDNPADPHSDAFNRGIKVQHIRGLLFLGSYVIEQAFVTFKRAVYPSDD